jgi:ABC-type glycerol-3-phosphate transport system substrate-binding protein
MPDINTLVFAHGKLYFTSWFMSEDDPFSSGMRIYSIEVDGSNLTELVNYSTPRPTENAMGSVFINALRGDDEGNIWVTENGNFFGFDLPDDFDEETAEPFEMWRYQYEIGNIMTVRKLDGTGAELLSVDISSLAANTDFFHVNTFNIDSEGNIYIAANQTIHVLDRNGRVQFRLETDGWVDQLIRMSDGSIAFFGFTGTGRALRIIDFATRSWGEDIEIPMMAHQVFPGAGDYSLVFSDGSGLFGIENSSGESVRMLNWIDSDVMSDRMENITILPDGRVLCTNMNWDRFSGRPSIEIVILTKVPYASLPQRTVITLATVWLEHTLRSAIVNFNRTNSTYRIRVIDYSEFNTPDDFMAGLTRLSTEIISGRIPDILDVSSLPFQQYVTRGILEDLYPFIDADPQLSRSDLMESVFRASEINGGLYQLFPTFMITTLIGHPSVLGPGMGWNMDEFREVLRTNPQADQPMGPWFTGATFLNMAVMMSIDEYVDWAAGTTSFDAGGFAQLLEFTTMFPTEQDIERDSIGRGGMVIVSNPDDAIATGRQIMSMEWVSDFWSIQRTRAMFGGEIVFKGFPTESRNGNALNINSGLALTSASAHKEGAWEFMRTILTEDWQRTMGWGFPTNRNVFNERLEQEMTPQFWTDEDGNEIEISRGGIGWGDGNMIEIFAMTQREADQFLEFIDSVSGMARIDQSLMTIINEGVADFFNGRNSAQDAARIIQNRASILVAERS